MRDKKRKIPRKVWFGGIAKEDYNSLEIESSTKIQRLNHIINGLNQDLSETTEELDKLRAEDDKKTKEYEKLKKLQLRTDAELKQAKLQMQRVQSSAEEALQQNQETISELERKLEQQQQLHESQIRDYESENLELSKKEDELKRQKEHLEHSVYEKIMSKLGYVFKCLNKKTPDIEALANAGRLPEKDIKYANKKMREVYHSINSLIDFCEKYAKEIVKTREQIATKENKPLSILTDYIKELLTYMEENDTEQISKMPILSVKFKGMGLSGIQYMQIAKFIDGIRRMYGNEKTTSS